MKSALLLLCLHLVVLVLLDIAYAVSTKDLPWYHWIRGVKAAIQFGALVLFAIYVWPLWVRVWNR